MSRKGEIFRELKSKYNLDDRTVQSYWSNVEKFGCTFERYVEYRKVVDNKNFRLRYDLKEKNIILNAPTLAEGLIKVHKIRKEESEKRAIIALARDKKIAALKTDLLKVCKKHNAKLLNKKEMERLIDAPYAADLFIDFPFGITI